MTRVNRPYKKPGRKYKRLNEQQIQQLQEMYRKARNCSGHMEPGHPTRVASETFTKHIAELHLEHNYPRTEIARAVGVHHCSIRWRLIRHGYLKPCKSEEIKYSLRKYKNKRTPYDMMSL